MNKAEIFDAFKKLKELKTPSLKANLSRYQEDFVGTSKSNIEDHLSQIMIDPALLQSATLIKRLSSQINEIVHASTILLALPNLLEPGEKIESLSLGAGNTGVMFDLETNKRVAEFKCIFWRGGPEAIRQNSLFADFYKLAEYQGAKRKHLYVFGDEYPLQFLTGGRAIRSVLSLNVTLWADFQDKYGPDMVVREYYEMKKSAVKIEDINAYLDEPIMLGA